jgi:hypothetical protein
MRTLHVIVFGLAATLAAGTTASADVHVSMTDGRVSVEAKDATVRQILAEWARVGQTKIVNAERIAGGPITIELKDVPEKDALAVLLRTVSGYVAAPRAVPVSGASVYDRILVLPTSAAPAVSASRMPAPAFQQPQAPAFNPADDDDEGRPAPDVVMPNRGPVFNAFPQPQIVNPRQNQPQNGVSPNDEPIELPQPTVTQPGATPGAGSAPTPSPYGGVAVPGMVVPTPQPQQPGQPAPAQPRRPGGPGGALDR